MDWEIVNTKDGSKSVFSKKFDASFHSWYGAVSEAKHVFIENGLAYRHMQGIDPVKILEIGYGTGLNAILSGIYALENDVEVIYSGLDKYEFPRELVQELNYAAFFDPSYHEFIRNINDVPYDAAIKLHGDFTLIKSLASLKDTELRQNYDVIYFDAFSPRQVPYMWTVEVFKKMYGALNPGGVLVTFCAQTQFKRDLQEAGFEVEILPGAPGKREMTRGTRKEESK
jgi:tRNA U34 5-methylaminomethyl-2-thiouridine-forming methyltransferase MnmC